MRMSVLMLPCGAARKHHQGASEGEGNTAREGRRGARMYGRHGVKRKWGKRGEAELGRRGISLSLFPLPVSFHYYLSSDPLPTLPNKPLSPPISFSSITSPAFPISLPLPRISVDSLLPQQSFSSTGFSPSLSSPTQVIQDPFTELSQPVENPFPLLPPSLLQHT